MCMSGCITFLQAPWGCRYLFTLALHVVRSCERPSDRSIPLVAAFLTVFLLTHERTLCVLLRKAKQRHFHGRPILYRAFPPSDTLWYVLFSLALLCSNIIKDSKHAGFCSKHLCVSEEPPDRATVKTLYWFCTRAQVVWRISIRRANR